MSLKQIKVEKEFKITDVKDKLLTVIGSEQELINYICAVTPCELISYDRGLYTFKTRGRFLKVSIQLVEDGYILSYHDEPLNGSREVFVAKKISNEVYLINCIYYLSYHNWTTKMIMRLAIEIGYLRMKYKTKKYIESL